MNVKKLSGSLAVAMSVLALSAPASADIDCNDLVFELETLADELRCERDAGYWDNDNAIWQYKGKGELGCAVHERLAKQLNEERDGTTPPPIKKGNNVAAGAANDLANGKIESAYNHLQTFIDTILYSSRLNGGFVDVVDDPRGVTAQDFADYFVGEALAAQSCEVFSGL